MRRQVRRAAGNILGMALAIVMLLVVVGAALAVVATLDLNFAATQEYSQRADQLARAGLAQFLEDMEQGYLDSMYGTAPATGLQAILEQGFLIPIPPPDPLSTVRQSALLDPNGPPYPIPGNHLEGQCYITFNPDRTGLAWSTWNAAGSVPVSGYLGRPVPAFSIDVVANAHVGGVTRRLAVHALRRWTYAVEASQPVFLSTSGGFPTTITGDVYSQSPPSTLGAIYDGYGWSSTSGLGAAQAGATVDGRLLATNPNPAAIQVSPQSTGGTQVSGYRTVACPTFQDVQVDSTWVNLASFTKAHPAPDGSYLARISSSGPPCGGGGSSEESPCGQCIPLPATPVPSSSATGLVPPGPTAAPTPKRVNGCEGYQDTGAQAAGLGSPCGPATNQTPDVVNTATPTHTPVPFGTATPDGAGLSPSPLPSGTPPCCSNVATPPVSTGAVYSIESPNANKPLVLTGKKYYVDGTLRIQSSSQAGGLRLTDATLKVRKDAQGNGGSLIFTDRPTSVVGTRSAISVDQDFEIRFGFLQSDAQDGFVIKANRLICQTGGSFHGLVVVQGGVFISQLNLNNSDLSQGAWVQPADLEAGDLLACEACTCPSGACQPACRRPLAPSPTHAVGAPAPEGGRGTCSGPCQGYCSNSPPPDAITPTTVNAVLPPGAPPGANGVYPMRITGAVLAPSLAPPGSTPLVVSSVSVTLDPVYLAPLNRVAPVTTRAWEVLP